MGLGLDLSLTMTQGTVQAAPTSAPVNSVVPAITGIKTNGQTLTASTGTWSNSPTSYAYQWKRGVTNVGTNSSTYVLVTGDVASTMTVTVTATNAIGSGTPAVSTATSAIAAVLSISGTPVTTATQNSAYTGFSVSGAGGHTAYVYSVASGALPTGLTLNSSTGAVAGTPTLAETQTGIVIRVTDSDGLTADLASFQIAVSAAASGVTWNPADHVTSTLSAGNLKATSTGLGGFGRATGSGYSTGTLTFSWTYNSLAVPGAGSTGAGWARSDMDPTGKFLGWDTKGFGLFDDDNVYYNSVLAATFGTTHAQGDTIDLEITVLSSSSLSVRRRINGGSWSSPATLTGLTGFPMFPAFGTDTSGDAITASFSALP